MAPKYGLACLLHWKPFAGVNGSGKHNNWSLWDEFGDNLRVPATLRTRMQSWLRRRRARGGRGRVCSARASRVGDKRLGANEAPPAILSVFLGDMLTDIFEQLEKGAAKSTKRGGTLDLGVSVLPKLPRDAGGTVTAPARSRSPAISSNSAPCCWDGGERGGLP